MPPPPQHRISATVTWHNYVSLFVHREPQRSVAAFRRLSASSPASSSIELASSKAQERRFGHLHSIKSPLTNEGIPTRCRKKQYHSSKGAWFVNKTGATRNWGLEQVDQRRSGHKFEKINKDFTLACPAPNPSLIISHFNAHLLMWPLFHSSANPITPSPPRWQPHLSPHPFSHLCSCLSSCSFTSTPPSFHTLNGCMTR